MGEVNCLILYFNNVLQLLKLYTNNNNFWLSQKKIDCTLFFDTLSTINWYCLSFKLVIRCFFFVNSKLREQFFIPDYKVQFFFNSVQFKSKLTLMRDKFKYL